MTTCSVYIATSLDGFIARSDGGLDWLPGSDGSRGDEDYGYADFIGSVDHLVMGRNTFEMVAGFGDWPYALPVIVLATKQVTIPRSLEGKVEWMAGEPSSIVEALSERGANDLYIDGGTTIQRFLRAGLIDRLILTRVPVLLGSGISLFGELDDDLHLRHVATRSFPTGLVQDEYERPPRPEPSSGGAE